jgi:hypothetical protein
MRTTVTVPKGKLANRTPGNKKRPEAKLPATAEPGKNAQTYPKKGK